MGLEDYLVINVYEYSKACSGCTGSPEMSFRILNILGKFL